MEVMRNYFGAVFVLRPQIFRDERGYFYESFNAASFQKAASKEVNFVQDNQSFSNKNVIRGLHLQAPPHTQGKLVRVTSGKALDIFVDLRKDSPTYGQWESVELTPENRFQVFIPEGFAHGFAALEDATVFLYKCTKYYNKASEMSIKWDDPTLNIDWKIEPDVLSQKDERGTLFKDFNSPF